jgi:hypothetical protein
MSVQINSFDLAPILIQTGYGIPDHISPLGSEYTDLYTAFKYYNTNGLAHWVQYLDSSFSGGGGSTIFTGGTVTGPTIFTAGLTANTISATTYLNLPTDIRVTGGTYSTGTATFTNNTGGTFSVTGFSTSNGATFTGGTVTGATNFTNGLTANTFSATTYQGLPTDVRVTGGTYNGGNILFTNNTGGTFNVTGITVTSGYSSNYYASFSNTGNIPVSGANTATLWTYNTTEISNGIVIQNNSQIKVNNTGVYEFAYSPQIEKTQGTDANITIWAAINGVPVVRSSSTLRLVSNSTLTLPYVSFIFQMNANDYLEFYFSSDSQYVQLTSLSGGTGPTRPISPALIVVVKQVGNAISNTLTGSYLPLSGGTVSGTTNFTGGLTATTISATTYYNLPITADTFTTGFSYSNNTFTINRNQGLSALTASINTMTGLTVNGNLTVTGTTFKGNGTFTKSGYAIGDVLLDNSATDTPGVLFYYGNNSNYGIDSYNGSFDILSGQLFRITNKLNESGGAVKMAIDTSGNVVATGFVKANAWRAGQVIQDVMLSNTEVTVSTTSIATSTSDTDFVTYSYTPLSSSSYLVIHYHLADYDATSGGGNDSWISRIKVDGAEITYAVQSTVNGFRTGVLFPLTGRYTNSNTTAKSIVVACRRITADDSITITNTATSMWLRITEIAR